MNRYTRGVALVCMVSYTRSVAAEQTNKADSGRVIDEKYKLGRIIGSGGMGTVYEATQIDLERKVALKILRNRYAKSSKIVTRFQQEARLAGSIEHDNICRVTDHGTDENGAPYLVMPLLHGRSLAKMLEDKEPISQMRVIDIVCQTLMALEAAHQEKIVHRDLKPDNIFVTQIGDREDFVKLLDFGISKVLEKESVSTLTSTGMILGTAYYLAPEQARGAKYIDHRVDIYAMGVILYEALTGQRPFEGETYNEVMFKIAGDPPKPPRSLNPSISRSVEKVIIRAMAIDPKTRYARASNMCSALEAALVNASEGAEHPLKDTLADTDDAPGTSPSFKTKGSESKYSWRLAALIVGIALLVIAASIYLSDDTDTKTRTEAAVPTPEKRAKPQSVQKKEETPQSPSAPVPPQISKDSKTENNQQKQILTDATETKKATKDTPPTALSTKEKSFPTKTKGARTQSATKKTPKKTRKKGSVRKKDIKGQFGTTFVFEEE